MEAFDAAPQGPGIEVGTGSLPAIASGLAEDDLAEDDAGPPAPEGPYPENPENPEQGVRGDERAEETS
jgi:hypothetical protein